MKSLILVHGRSWKPPRDSLKELWIAAIRYGLERDFPDTANLLDDVRIEFVYFGDISNELLYQHEGEAPADDTDSRQITLDKLKAWRATQFTKRNYERLPGKESFKEGIADVLSPLLSFFHLSDELISAVAPDMKAYWQGADSDFGSRVRARLTKPLQTALDNNDSICLLGHSLGSMVAYDVLWKFAYRGEYRPAYCDKVIDLFLTLGSPLGDTSVQRGLLGAGARRERKYPCNIRKWINIAAEDDFISHDKRIRNDYRKMIRWGMIESIKDYRIYNLAVRESMSKSGLVQKSNPHHSGGYLIHPRVSRVLMEWIMA